MIITKYFNIYEYIFHTIQRYIIYVIVFDTIIKKYSISSNIHPVTSLP